MLGLCTTPKRLLQTKCTRQVEQPQVEEDSRYIRQTSYQKIAHEARLEFVRHVAGGEARIHMARAALQIAAEDDAIVSQSPVTFPVDSYLKRIHILARDFAQRDTLLPAIVAAHPADSPLRRKAVLMAAQDYLFDECGFRLPDKRSNMPEQAVVDNPGVWEDAALAYMPNILVSRKGTASGLAIVLAELLGELLRQGHVDFLARISVADLDRLPIAEAVDIPPAAAMWGGQVLNVCPIDVLLDLLRHLKRAYWPAQWDSSVDNPMEGGLGTAGGFRAAAERFLDGEANATVDALARYAEYRQARGIHTSTGAGDHRRALATCERLALLAGDKCTLERRDLGVLYATTGRMADAFAELRYYCESEHFSDLTGLDKLLVERLVKSVQDQLDGSVECGRLTVKSMMDDGREPWYGMVGPKYRAIPW